MARADPRVVVGGHHFRDASALSMRDQSLVIIYGATGAQVRRYAGRARLERGGLVSRLDELSGKKNRVLIETVGADAELAEGMALVRIGDGGASVISNFEGKAATITGKSKRGKKLGKVTLKKGYGTRAVVGKRPSKPRKLAKAPTLTAIVHDDVLGKATGSPEVSWSPVDGAAYRDTGGVGRVEAKINDQVGLRFSPRGDRLGATLTARDEARGTVYWTWGGLSALAIVVVGLAMLDGLNEGPAVSLALGETSALDLGVWAAGE